MKEAETCRRERRPKWRVAGGCGEQRDRPGLWSPPVTGAGQALGRQDWSQAPSAGPGSGAGLPFLGVEDEQSPRLPHVPPGAGRVSGSAATQTPGGRQPGARSAPARGLERGHPHSVSPES